MKNLAKSLMTIMVILSAVHFVSANVLFTEKVGGTNGTNFMLPAERFEILNTENIAWIGVQHGRRVEQIVIEYENRQNISKVETAGNNQHVQIRRIILSRRELSEVSFQSKCGREFTLKLKRKSEVFMLDLHETVIKTRGDRFFWKSKG